MSGRLAVHRETAQRGRKPNWCIPGPARAAPGPRTEAGTERSTAWRAAVESTSSRYSVTQATRDQDDSHPAEYREIELGGGLPRIPERLLLGRVVFVAGAGVSMQAPSCLPGFGALVEQVIANLDQACGEHLRAGSRRPGATAGQDLLPPLSADQWAMLGRVDDREYDIALGMLERRMDRDQLRKSTVRQAVADILRGRDQHAPSTSHLFGCP